MMLFVFLFGCSEGPTSTTTQGQAKKWSLSKKAKTPLHRKKILKKEKNLKISGNISKLYKTQANNLVQAIEGTTAAPEILKLADELTVTGLSLLPTMIQAHQSVKIFRSNTGCRTKTKRLTTGRNESVVI